MRRIIIRTLVAALLVLGWQRAWGFAFLGPFFGPDATWQTIELGYNMAYEDTTLPGSPNWLGDVGGPKNIGEAFRRNDPVLYYSYDATFSGFFGLIGETNVDQAFTIMNNVFNAHPSGVDGYSTNLTEFPFDSQSFNGTAQGYYLTDIKSVTLHLLVEQMGLAEPERYTWTLHDRESLPPPPCPMSVRYLVVQRNYGFEDQPLTGPQTGTIYSPYVNNILYTYDILDDCGRHPPAWTAVTVPFAVKTTTREYTAVAANDFEGGVEPGQGGLEIGGFYTGLTEDDVAGLRYLMTSNNIEFENPAAGSDLQVTNAETPVQIFPLFPLEAYAQTNPPANVMTFAAAQGYANLVIDPIFSNYYTQVTNYIVTSSFVPSSQGAGYPPNFVVTTNGFFLTWQTNYLYTFDNMVFLQYSSNTPAQLQTSTVGIKPGSPAGGPITTNVVTNAITLNIPSGEFYLLPTNSCGVNLVYTNGPQFIGYITNFFTQATNTISTGSLNGTLGTESILVPLSNSIAEGFACTLVASNGPDYYQGIQQIKFVRIADLNVDPLTRLYRVPITNTYTMTVATNHVRQIFERVVTQPDILLSAFDDAQANTFNGTVVRTAPNFDTSTVQPGLSGPGVINGPVQFDFNKVGTAWWNGPFQDTNSLLFGPASGAEVNQTTATPSLLWASFDGTTNMPIVYPNTASLQELQSQMIITISPTSLPNGTTNASYGPVYFSATGGTPPYTWSVATNSSLPSGLVFFGGVLSGTPMTTNGTYDVSIQLMDSSNPTNTVVMPYTINLN